jgi:hypothetical protein
MYTGSFIVIGFKANNAGLWLMHCHIADYALVGLTLQILERQADAAFIWPTPSPAWKSASLPCIDWKDWVKTSYKPTATLMAPPAVSEI